MEQIKTGTTTVGIICKDGIVLGADNRATAGHFIARKDMDKVIVINDNIAVTVAGSVSDIQMFIKLFRAELKLKAMRVGRAVSVKEAANYAARICYENARQYFPSMAHLLVGGFDNAGTKMYEVDIDGCMLETKDYVSTGSGSRFAFGVLESSYKEGLNVKEGEDLIIKALSTAMQRDSGSGNGLSYLTITKDGMKKIVQKKVNGNLM